MDESDERTANIQRSSSETREPVSAVALGRLCDDLKHFPRTCSPAKTQPQTHIKFRGRMRPPSPFGKTQAMVRKPSLALVYTTSSILTRKPTNPESAAGGEEHDMRER